MQVRSVARVVLMTWGFLLAGWVVTLPAARRAFLRRPAIIIPEETGAPPAAAQGPCAATGTLLVFLANIATVGLFTGSLFSPALAARLARRRLPLPRALNLAGACLFVANGVWGVLVMIANPGYTPFFVPRTGAIRLATTGPYAVVRHPRYAAEASLNLILAAFTGTWLPLLGLLGWPAMRRQAANEEAYLLRVAPADYAQYRSRTGGFLPARLHLTCARPTRQQP